MSVHLCQLLAYHSSRVIADCQPHLCIRDLQLVTQLPEGVVTQQQSSINILSVVCGRPSLPVSLQTLSITNVSSQLHLWLEGLLLIFVIMYTLMHAYLLMVISQHLVVEQSSLSASSVDVWQCASASCTKACLFYMS